MEKRVKTFTLPFDGDLYRFFYTEAVEVISIRIYPMMETQCIELTWNELPNEVKHAFETHFCK